MSPQNYWQANYGGSNVGSRYQTPSYAYNSSEADPTYTGGLIGEQADYDMRNALASQAAQAGQFSDSGSSTDRSGDLALEAALNAQNQNAAWGSRVADLYGSAGPMATAEQIAAARGDLGTAQNAWKSLIDRPYYAPGVQDQIEGQTVQGYSNQAAAMQASINNALSARGLSANPLAAAAVGQAGQFAAAGKRGDIRADMAEKSAAGNQQNYITGTQGLSGIQEIMAKYASAPTYENWQNQAANAVSAGRREMNTFSPIDTSRMNSSSSSKSSSGSKQSAGDISSIFQQFLSQPMNFPAQQQSSNAYRNPNMTTFRPRYM